MAVTERDWSEETLLRPGSLDASAGLLRRARAGDERAFEAIFKTHYAPLLSYCRHMLGDRDEGEDALQQTFIRAYRALLAGTAPRQLRPWLYAIARNCCLSAIAARRPTLRIGTTHAGTRWAARRGAAARGPSAGRKKPRPRGKRPLRPRRTIDPGRGHLSRSQARRWGPRRERFLKQRPAPANTVRLAVRPARRPRRVPSRELLRPLKWKRKARRRAARSPAQRAARRSRVPLDRPHSAWQADNRPTFAAGERLRSSWIQRKKRGRSIMRSWGLSRASLAAGVLLALTPTAALAHSHRGHGWHRGHGHVGYWGRCRIDIQSIAPRLITAGESLKYRGASRVPGARAPGRPSYCTHTRPGAPASPRCRARRPKQAARTSFRRHLSR